MKKIIIAGFLFATLPTIVMAQKHAPRPYVKKVAHGIYPEGSTRLLRQSDMEGLTSWDLKVMRNEIFARDRYRANSGVKKIKTTANRVFRTC